MLPRVLAEDRTRVNTATQSYFSDNAFSQRVNLTIFGISTVIAMLVGGLVLRYLVRGLNKLKEGAEQVGHRRLDFRIDLKTNDELGELASAFNEMAVIYPLRRKNWTGVIRNSKPRSATPKHCC